MAYVVWDQIETRALAREIAAIAARGEPTTVAAIPTGGDTSERQLAARVYAAAAEHVRALPPEITFRLPRLDVDSVASPVVNLEELERTYRHDAPALQLIDQAAPLDFNGFGDLGPEVRDQSLPTLAYLCALRADLLSARGRGEAAADALVPCARVWRTVPVFTRFQISARLLGSLRILLRHTGVSPGALARLQAAFEAHPDADDLVADVRLRRARFLDGIAAPRQSVEAIVRRGMRPWIARSNRHQLETFDEALAVAAQPWPQKVASAMEMERKYGDAFRAPPRRGLVARQTAPHGLGFTALGLRPAGMDLAARRVAITVLAVERFRLEHQGTPPPSLAALVPRFLRAVPVDPFSGDPLVYQLSSTDYCLYSVDQDMKDDGGAVYGMGSRIQRPPQQGAARDLGVRVALTR